MSNNDIMLEYLRSSIDHNGIYRCSPGKWLMGKAPNTSYRWQFYLRRCMFTPQFSITSAEYLIKKLNNPNNIQIAAVESAGVPLGIAMSNIIGVPLLTIKTERKKYGLSNWTEGTITGKPILLVDDLAGSASSLKNAEYVLKSYNLPVADEYAVLINKTQGTHQINYLEEKTLHFLFTCEDFSMSWKAYVDRYNKEPNFGSWA